MFCDKYWLARQQVIEISEDISSGHNAYHFSIMDYRQMANILFDHCSCRSGG